MVYLITQRLILPLLFLFFSFSWLFSYTYVYVPLCFAYIFYYWNIIQSHPFTVRHGGSDVWGEWAFEKILVESRTNLSDGPAEEEAAKNL